MKKKKSYYKPKAKKTAKVTTVKKKSYYKPKKKTAKAAAPVVKKKYKSYYKPKGKKVKDVGSAYIAPLNVKTLSEAHLDAEFAKHPVGSTTISKSNMDKAPTTSKRPVKYLNNKDLLAQVILSKKNGKMTNELAKMLQLLTMRYGKKGNFANYTYNDDMQSYAMLMIVKTWNGFDPAKSSNPFAWFTQCIKNSFIQYLNYEKRQRDIRDEVLVDSGMLPSYNYQQEYAEEHKAEGSPENENVELPSKPSHNDVTFEVPEEDDVPVEVLQY
jgi:hypothetical protein